MFDTMTEKKNKCIINISIFSEICDQDLSKEIKIIVYLLLLLSVIIFNTMKLLSIVKAGKTKAKGPYEIKNELNCI